MIQVRQRVTRLAGLSLCLLSGPHILMAQPLACEQLSGLRLPQTTITHAVVVPAAPYTGLVPGLATGAPVPAHCEVDARLSPSDDSDIRFVVWLPLDGWNGKYRQEGNSGFAGVVPIWNLIDPLRRGYATAATDDGHEDPTSALGGSFTIGHPEKLTDFGYRAVHETAVRAKAIVSAYYGRSPAESYFAGCSTGGREGLMVAQRYPTDFQGIVSAAPAPDYVGALTAHAWNQRAMLEAPLPVSLLGVIQRAVLDACDALDGVVDGLLDDPRQCRFEPRTLACTDTRDRECLSNEQVATLRKVYDGPVNAKGLRLFPGLMPGAEGTPRTWTGWMVADQQSATLQYRNATSYFGQIVFEQQGWDLRQLDFDRDVARAYAKTGTVLNATNPDLRPFRAAGGKLLIYHGWGDAAISPLSSIAYFESVRSTGIPTDFLRLFLVPGMAHCGGSIGPSYFGNVGLGDPAANRDAQRDVFSALERWVEQGVPPEQIIGRGTLPGDVPRPMTRPVCAYPTVARYQGSGDIAKETSFHCEAP